jgi:hypothetical protein
MMKILCRLCLPILFLFTFGAVCSIHADTKDLVKILTDQLGVTGEQASGGAGAIFKYAKTRLSAADFSTVTKALPGIDSLISAAPKTGVSGDLVTGLKSLSGGQSGSAAAMSSLAGSFSKLGMNTDMAGKFIPIVLDYAKSKGGPAVMNILKEALL